MFFFFELLEASWVLLLDAAPFVLFGMVIGGFFKAFLSTEQVARHLGKGRVTPVIKAALLGIPLPLCSCGVLPAAAALRRQGASRGATTAFLISTPETGVDSIAVSFALLDPLLTLARPIAAFLSATVAGTLTTLAEPYLAGALEEPASPATSSSREATDSPTGLGGRLREGLRYAFGDLWEDIAVYFLLGIVLAGLVTVVLPDAIFGAYLGGGLTSMLLALFAGVPLYLCASASTPVAAALILKGASPGVALVFLLAGPATNITSLTVMSRILGRRGTVLTLASIGVVSIACGLLLDWVYALLGVSPVAVLGRAGEFMPEGLQIFSALLLLLLSFKPLERAIRAKLGRLEPASQSACGCSQGPSGGGHCRSEGGCGSASSAVCGCKSGDSCRDAEGPGSASSVPESADSESGHEGSDRDKLEAKSASLCGCEGFS